VEAFEITSSAPYLAGTLFINPVYRARDDSESFRDDKPCDIRNWREYTDHTFVYLASGLWVNTYPVHGVVPEEATVVDILKARYITSNSFGRNYLQDNDKNRPYGSVDSRWALGTSW
jgi:hypothetical protein